LIFRVTLRNVLDMDASGLIEQRGGPAVMAQAINERPGVVRTWKHRNQIPRRAWPEILEAFPDLTMDALKAAEGR
jgi:hypothetical protein